MKPKPEGAKYRNLHAYRGSIWYDRTVEGKRHRIDLETAAWGEAAGRRDAWEELHGIPGRRQRGKAPRTLAELADEYLENALGRHKPATVSSKCSHVRRLKADLGERTPAEIDFATLRDWWEAFVVKGGRKANSGNLYVKTLSQILRRGRADASGLEEFRRYYLADYLQLSTVRAEARSEPNPIESDAALSKLLAVVRGAGVHGYAFVLCMLDGGMRPSEVLAMHEEDLVLGAGPGDPTRHVHVRRTLSAGVEVRTTKTGKSRRVEMSRRLRAALLRVKAANGGRDPALPFLGHELPTKSSNLSLYYWHRWAARAGISGHRLYDLRASYASRMLTAGFPLSYVAGQLGDKMDTAERFYARWLPRADGGLYVEPERLGPGEVPADLVARRVPVGRPEGAVAAAAEA